MPDDVAARLQEIEDRQAILDLKAAYHDACDGWRGPTHDADAVAALFTEDGVYDLAPEGTTARGREEVRALIASWSGISFAFHTISNAVVHVDGDTATATFKLVLAINLPDETGGERAYWVMGRYSDEFVRTPEGWRFTLLSFDQAVTAPYEDGWGGQRVNSGVTTL